MNKAGKMAFSWLREQTDIDKIRFIAQAMGSADYQAFNKKNSPDKQYSHNIPVSFLKWYLPRHLTITSDGKPVSLRSVPQTNGDKLEILHPWMPTGQFAPSRNGSYIPLGNNFSCTALMRPVLQKRQEACLAQAWKAIIPHLCSPDVGNDRSFTDPWLDYDPYLSSDADVYFLLDETQNRVKIGVSSKLSQRIDSLKRQHDAATLSFISIIPSGGMETESALHRFFQRYRVEEKGLGREWFSYSDELREFIDTLNTYAIRSKCLKAYGIL